MLIWSLNAYWQKKATRTIEKFNPSTPGISERQAQLEDQGQDSLPYAGPIYTSSGGVTGGARNKTPLQQHSSRFTNSSMMPAGGATQSGLDDGTKTLVDVLSRQNEVSELIVKQQRLSLLPVKAITAFSGEPLQYQSFI